MRILFSRPPQPAISKQPHALTCLRDKAEVEYGFGVRVVVAWYYSYDSPACGEAASGAPGGCALPPVSFYVAGLWGSPYAYRILSYDGNKVTFKTRASRGLPISRFSRLNMCSFTLQSTSYNCLETRFSPTGPSRCCISPDKD